VEESEDEDDAEPVEWVGETGAGEFPVGAVQGPSGRLLQKEHKDKYINI